MNDSYKGNWSFSGDRGFSFAGTFNVLNPPVNNPDSASSTALVYFLIQSYNSYTSALA